MTGSTRSFGSIIQFIILQCEIMDEHTVKLYAVGVRDDQAWPSSLGCETVLLSGPRNFFPKH